MNLLAEYQKRVSYLANADFLKDLEKSECFIITDSNLEKLYQKALFPNTNYYSIRPGEQAKTLNQVNEILEKLLEYNYTRNLIILGLGGGVVCDLAGFISAIYKRGCRVALMPTSLIAMVDAAIGGKNGVNSVNFKNQFGTIKQPDFLNLDFTFLKTLPEREMNNGIPELLKHGLIFSEEFFNKVKTFKFKDANNIQLAELIKESIKIKLTFVSGDENDKGQRRFLNFGHTLGHVIEKLNNVPHGYAVLWGMLQAVKLSYALQLISQELVIALKADLDRFNCVSKGSLSWSEISKALLNDKKREGQKITFVLLAGVGKALIKELDLETIKEVVMSDE